MLGAIRASGATAFSWYTIGPWEGVTLKPWASRAGEERLIDQRGASSFATTLAFWTPVFVHLFP